MFRILHIYENIINTIVATTTTGSSSSSSSSSSSVSMIVRTTTNIRHNFLSTKSVLTIPLVLLFLSNMMACIVSILTNQMSHTTKKRLKAILNMNKCVELIVIVYNVIRLLLITTAISSQQSTNKEIYIGRIFHAILFIIQGQAYTRFSWDSDKIAPSIQSLDNHHPQNRRTTTSSSSITSTPVTGWTTTTDHPSQPIPSILPHQRPTTQYTSSNNYNIEEQSYDNNDNHNADNYQ